VRIVIDTNIWISGLLWRGDAWRLLNLAEQGRVELCVAYPMLLELEEVLAYERFQPRLETLQQTPAQLAVYALSLPLRLTCPEASPPLSPPIPTMTSFCCARLKRMRLTS